jgi:uncharacterized protein (DUF3820 family)
MIINFGKHKGTHIENVPDEYLLWLSEQDIRDVKLKEYLDNNIKAIKFRVEDNKRQPKHFFKMLITIFCLINFLL